MEASVVREVFDRAGECLARVPGNLVPPGGYFSDVNAFLRDLSRVCDVAAVALAPTPPVVVGTQDAAEIAANAERVRSAVTPSPDPHGTDTPITKTAKDGDCNCH